VCRSLEFTCWNGEIVRIAFVLDYHDREVIAWLATTAGISGEMIRDMMIECVERRFGGSRAPHKVQWLTDSRSIFAAYKTMNIALAPKTGDGRKAPLNEKRLTHWFYLYPGDACHGW
jgi:putative transposase